MAFGETVAAGWAAEETCLLSWNGDTKRTGLLALNGTDIAWESGIYDPRGGPAPVPSPEEPSPEPSNPPARSPSPSSPGSSASFASLMRPCCRLHVSAYSACHFCTKHSAPCLQRSSRTPGRDATPNSGNASLCRGQLRRRAEHPVLSCQQHRRAGGPGVQRRNPRGLLRPLLADGGLHSVLLLLC